MRDLSLAIANRGTRNTSSSFSVISVYRLNLAILASIVLLGLMYLFVVNSLGTKGYEIRKLEEQIRLLQADQKNLQMQSSDLQSIGRIETEVSKLNFVPATNVTYLKAADYALK